ncbi:hypothetical protein WG66_003316, partial [Moniliophthora roreri]
FSPSVLLFLLLKMKLDNSRYDGGNTDVDQSEIWYRRGTCIIYLSFL